MRSSLLGVSTQNHLKPPTLSATLQPRTNLRLRSPALPSLRSGVSRKNIEELSCYLYGINRKFEVVSIVVYVKGKSVRLSGPHGSHHVHPSNERGYDGWKREAALVWNLTDIEAVPRVLLNSDSDKTKFEALKQKADHRKREAEEYRGSNPEP
jgi:hypothetical protein